MAPGVHWHALEDDVVVGRAHALHRPDGRVFLSVDTWRDDVFAVLADAMVRDLPPPVHTVVDEDDREVLARWSSQGFVDHRYEGEYVVPTGPAPAATGRTPAPAATGRTRVLPPDTVVLPADRIGEQRLRALDGLLRQEIERSGGWAGLPAQLMPPPADGGAFDASQYTVVVHQEQDAGLLRIAPLPGRPRLGLIAVRSAYRRRGLARALLADALGALRDRGIAAVRAEVDAGNVPAQRLLASFGASRTGGAVELVHRPPVGPTPPDPPS